MQQFYMQVPCNMSVYECNGNNNFTRWHMKHSISRGKAEWNRTFHLSPHEIILSIAQKWNFVLYNTSINPHHWDWPTIGRTRHNTASQRAQSSVIIHVISNGYNTRCTPRQCIGANNPWHRINDPPIRWQGFMEVLYKLDMPPTSKTLFNALEHLG